MAAAFAADTVVSDSLTGGRLFVADSIQLTGVGNSSKLVS
jgi:hypothetical protein